VVGYHFSYKIIYWRLFFLFLAFSPRLPTFINFRTKGFQSHHKEDCVLHAHAHLAVSIFMLFNGIIDYPAKLELRTLSCMIEDLGFYANNINSTLYDDSVVEKFTPQKQNLRSVRNAITQTPNIITTIISMPYVYSFYYLETLDFRYS
jgi:hypothetical protein